MGFIKSNARNNLGMEDSKKSDPSSRYKDDPERFEFPIIALVPYGLERCLAFAFLQSRSASAGALESMVMGFLFGQPPYSIFNILLGFELNRELFVLIQPRILLSVAIQIIHFWMNYWIVRFPFMAVTWVGKHKAD
jgi:hypothetical protein